MPIRMFVECMYMHVHIHDKEAGRLDSLTRQRLSITFAKAVERSEKLTRLKGQLNGTVKGAARGRGILHCLSADKDYH